MRRWLIALVPLSIAAFAWAADSGSDAPPLVYELSINGESFFIEPERQVDLKSKQNPGTTYKVALRLAPHQRWVMNTIRFEYDGGFSIDDDNDLETRTATLKHAQGFSLVVMDFGEVLGANSRTKMLEKLTESITGSYRGAGATDLNIGKPVDRKYATSSGGEITVHYVDGRKKKMTSRIFVLAANNKTAGFVLSYPTQDEAQVAPLARVTLDSLLPKDAPATK